MRTVAKFSILLSILLLFQTVNADWVKQKTTSFAWLRDVHFQNENEGWIVGTDGTLLSTRDGGVNWTQTPKFTTDSFIQIRFTDKLTGWLLCERNIYSRGKNATSYLRKTIDGGRTWESIEFEDGGRERVTKLLFNSQGWGIAFGEGGIFYRLSEDGRTWKKSVSSIHFLLLGGSFSDGSNGVIAGSGGTLMFTETNGLTWEKASLIGDTNIRINSVFFANQKMGWAVGSGGAILTSSGGGRLWRTQVSGTATNLNDVYFQNSREGWAVGDQGTILRTRDGGAFWEEINSRVKHRLERVYFYGKRGWVVGFGGTILYYSGDANDPASGKPVIQGRN